MELGKGEEEGNVWDEGWRSEVRQGARLDRGWSDNLFWMLGKTWDPEPMSDLDML